jgi:hypothetical protein
MKDPFANLPTLDTSKLPTMEDITGRLKQMDDVPSFDPTADPEVDIHAALQGDRVHMQTPTRRLFVDYRANPDAYKHLATLPAPGESLHGVISGKYALFELIAAIIERTGSAIEHLTLATLSFSKNNASELLGMLDGGHIDRVSLLVSYYFKSTNREIYDSLVPELRRRGHKVLAMRTHCKITLARMKNGTCYVAESSANLRSSKNVEQFVLTNCPDLYQFHYDWINGELLAGKELGEPDEIQTAKAAG